MGKLRIVFATLGAVAVVVGVAFGATAWATVGKAPAPAAVPSGFAVPHTNPMHPATRPETTFVPIAACRIVSTATAGGKLANGVARSYDVGGTVGFPAQGGRSGGCGIPVGADAITATLTAAQSGAPGFIRAWAHNGTEPAGNMLSYPATAQSTSSGVTVKIQNNAALALRVKNYGGPANVNIDVTGYYSEQMEGMISLTGAVYAGSNRIVSASVLAPG